jgi:hypothetical protein
MMPMLPMLASPILVAESLPPNHDEDVPLAVVAPAPARTDDEETMNYAGTASWRDRQPDEETLNYPATESDDDTEDEMMHAEGVTGLFELNIILEEQRALAEENKRSAQQLRTEAVEQLAICNAICNAEENELYEVYRKLNKVQRLLGRNAGEA